MRKITIERRKPSPFQQEHYRLSKLCSTLAADIRANDPAAAYITARAIIALGTRLKRKLEKHQEYLDLSENLFPVSILRLDGSIKHA